MRRIWWIPGCLLIAVVVGIGIVNVRRSAREAASAERWDQWTAAQAAGVEEASRVREWPSTEVVRPQVTGTLRTKCDMPGSMMLGSLQYDLILEPADAVLATLDTVTGRLSLPQTSLPQRRPGQTLGEAYGPSSDVARREREQMNRRIENSRRNFSIRNGLEPVFTIEILGEHGFRERTIPLMLGDLATESVNGVKVLTARGTDEKYCTGKVRDWTAWRLLSHF